MSGTAQEMAAISRLMTVTLDTTGAQAFLNRIGESIAQGFAEEVKRVGKRSGQSVALTFQAQGRPTRWPAWSTATIREHLHLAEEGHTFPAGPLTMLRVSDALYEAATATRPGESPNATVTADAWHWENTITLPYARRQDAMRPFFYYQDADNEAFTTEVSYGMRQRIQRAETL